MPWTLSWNANVIGIKQSDQISYFVSYFKHFEEKYVWTKELQKNRQSKI